MKTSKPSLEDYRAFHGMLCNPIAAHRCIQSFKGGAIVFACQEDYDASAKGEKKLADYDCNIVPIPLNLWTYYLLVLVSLTGLCSVLGHTKVTEATEYCFNNDHDKGNHHDMQLQFKKGDNVCIESSKTATKLPLVLPSNAIEYLIDQSSRMGPLSTERNISGERQEVTLLRRFEYDFGGYGSVMMLHFLCTNGRTHLMEIYRFNTESKIGVAVMHVSNFVNGFKSLLQKITYKAQPAETTKKQD